MRKNIFFFVVVILLSVSFSSCAYEELNELSASLPPQEEEILPEEEEETIEWSYSHSTLVKNETTLSEDGVVNFEIEIKDSYTAVYEGETVSKDSLRSYNFSNTQSAEWRSLGISFSKGYKAYQEEYTNHNNLSMDPIVSVDSTFCEEGGWSILRSTKEVQFNYNSTTNPGVDCLNPVAEASSFAGTFTDEKLGKIELKPVVVKIGYNNYPYHHKDFSFVYNEETSSWENLPAWEEDTQVGDAVVENGVSYLRYPFISEAIFTVSEFGFEETHNAEYIWMIRYNKAEYDAENSRLTRSFCSFVRYEFTSGWIL